MFSKLLIVSWITYKSIFKAQYKFEGPIDQYRKNVNKHDTRQWCQWSLE